MSAFAHQILVLGAQRDHEASSIAAIAWMTWDTLINLGDEVEYLWKGHAKWVQWVYAFIRYAPIVHGGVVLSHYSSKNNPPDRCRGYIAYELAFLELLTIAVEIVLMIRVFVLYKQNRFLKAFIITAFIAEIICMMVLISFVAKGQTFTSDCLAATSPRVFVGYWVSALSFETFLFVLTLLKCYRKKSERIASRRSVLFIFLRDGTWAFALIFVAMLLNTLMYQLNNTPRAGIGYYWELAVLSYAGSHVILNIRRLANPSYLSQTEMSTLWDQCSPDISSAGEMDYRRESGFAPVIELRRLSRAYITREK
ncbi:hypothetical protein PsYK624_082600 [Phanerochaete sordida]|uniref:DUF6533 domain-containing protein n=1 Tax=Phanerochaete sordida TaxID=48140 RepID=A0A9P3GAB2_9APHY|nr:hypothetical protein PsYK624_082600 [Phanerochaete sordida]